MTAQVTKIYDGLDPRDIPIYSVADVARFVGVPYQTLYSWLSPVFFDTTKGKVRRAIIERPNSHWKLSFLNLIEAHVVKSLRGRYKVPLNVIRSAIDFAERERSIERPLASQRFRTIGRQIFIEQASRLENVGRGGQLALSRILEEYLQRIEFDNDFAAILYPFGPLRESKVISISPYVGFGRPVVSEKSISTYVITNRYNLGETEEQIADDYGISEGEVEEAILYETAA